MIATNVLICFNYIWMIGMGIEPPLLMKSNTSTWIWSTKTWKLMSIFKEKSGRLMDAQLCVTDGLSS